MSKDKVKVKPRAGIILAGIPKSGAEVDPALAKEWIEAGLVIPYEDSKPDTTPPVKEKRP